MQSRIVLRNKSSNIIYNVGAILLVATIGLSLAFQGWNARTMNFDHINFIDGADKLLTNGILPDRGDVSSYWVFTTPGTAWLMVPGMFLFHDPRLYEFVMSAALYLGTLLGLFLVARMCFGLRAAYLSVLLYGLSRSGLFYAGSLWSIGHPFFYVWMVYFCILWVQRNDSNYLAAAFVTWSLGMYVDMVLAPAMFIFPVIWLIYRPKVRIAPMVLAIAIVSVTWFPYLRLQTTRNFADLKVLVMRQRSKHDDYKNSWCMPTLVLQRLKEPSSVSGAEPRLASTQIVETSYQQSLLRAWYEGLTKKIRLRYTTLTDGLTFNFDQMTWTPLAAVPLLLLAMSTLALIALQVANRSIAGANNRDWFDWIPYFAWTSLVLALLVNEVFVTRFLSEHGSLSRSIVLDIRILQVVLLMIGLALLLWKKELAKLLSRLMVQGEEFDSSQYPGNRPLFALGLLIPWLTLIMVVEPGEADRYWWLWPVQLVLLVAAVTYIPERLGWPRAVAWFGQVGLTLILLAHPWLASPVQAWIRSGWSGRRANDIQAVDYLASQVRSQGRNRVAIGYQTFIREFMAAFHAVDPRYKVGAELDLFLKHRYGISNSNQCAEGVSSEDEYRIVQTAPSPTEPKEFVEYFNIPLDPSFRMIRQFGDYQVFKRIESPAN